MATATAENTTMSGAMLTVRFTPNIRRVEPPA